MLNNTGGASSMNNSGGALSALASLSQEYGGMSVQAMVAVVTKTRTTTVEMVQIMPPPSPPPLMTSLSVKSAAGAPEAQQPSSPTTPVAAGTSANEWCSDGKKMIPAAVVTTSSSTSSSASSSTTPSTSDSPWFCMSWTLLDANAVEAPDVATATHVDITMQSRTAGYVSVGFGDVPGIMSPADAVYGWIDEATGEVVVSDRYNPFGYAESTVDASQDTVAVAGTMTADGVMEVTFRRALNTGDGDDKPSLDPSGTVNMIWAIHHTRPTHRDGKLATHTTKGRGTAVIQLACSVNCTQSMVGGGGAEVGAGGLFPSATPLWRVMVRATAAWVALAAAWRLFITASPVRVKSLFVSRQLGPAFVGELFVFFVFLFFAVEVIVRSVPPGATLAELVTKHKDFYTLSKVVGTLAGFCLAVALLPAPHAVSFFAWISGRAFDLMLRLHRVAGTIAVLAVVAHAAIATYSKARPDGDGGVVDMLLDFAPNRSGDGVIYGTLAGGCVLLLALTASSPFRRRFYNVFLASHRVMFAAIAMLSAVHASSLRLPLAFAVGLIVLDKIFTWLRRTLPAVAGGACGGAGGACTVAGVQSLPGGVVRLTVNIPRALGVPWSRTYHGMFAYIRFPSWGKWGGAGGALQTWHPFSVAGVHQVTGQNNNATAYQAVFVVKVSGGGHNFTSALSKFVDWEPDTLAEKSITVELDGLYDGPVSAEIKRMRSMSAAGFAVAAETTTRFARLCLYFFRSCFCLRSAASPSAVVASRVDDDEHDERNDVCGSCGCSYGSFGGAVVEEIVLVAGGVGITALLPLVETLSRNPPRGLRVIRLVWASPVMESFATWFPGRPLVHLRGAAPAESAAASADSSAFCKINGSSASTTAPSSPSSSQPRVEFSLHMYCTARSGPDPTAACDKSSTMTGVALGDGNDHHHLHREDYNCDPATMGLAKVHPQMYIERGRPRFEEIIGAPLPFADVEAARAGSINNVKRRRSGAVMACGPEGLVRAAREAAVAQGYSFDCELFHR